MVDYLKGIIFVIFHITLMLLIGTAIKNEKSAPVRIIIGYIFYNVIIGVFGIFLQFFQLPWKIYYYFVILVNVALLILSAIVIRRKHYAIFEDGPSHFIKKYWFVLFVALCAIATVSFYNIELWHNNTTDDAYYLVKMAALPYVKNPYNIYISTGTPATFNRFDIRNFNVFELEASVYIYILKIIPTLFARCFLAFINYFVYSCTIYMFAEKLAEKGNVKLNKNYLQYACAVMILFCFDTARLSWHHIIDVRDGWAINHAMYFSSALVRAVGIIWLIVPLIDLKKITIKSIVIFVLISFVLLVKSTVILPVIFIVACSYLLYYLLKKNLKLGILFAIIVFGFGIIIDKNIITLFYFDRMNNGINYFQNNMLSVFTIPFLLAIIFISIYKWNNYQSFSIFLLNMCLFFVVKPLHTLVMMFSIYGFVADRSVSTLWMYVIVYGGILLLLEILDFIKNYKIRHIVPILLISLSICYCLASGFIITRSLPNMKKEIHTFINNKYYVAQFEIDLGKQLNELSKKEQEPIVCYAPQYVYLYQSNHKIRFSNRYDIPSIALGGTIRQFAPNVVVPYPRAETSDSYNAYMKFIQQPNNDNYLKLKEKLENTNINCLIAYNNGEDEYLRRFGFKPYGEPVKSEYANLVIYYK